MQSTLILMTLLFTIANSCTQKLTFGTNNPQNKQQQQGQRVKPIPKSPELQPEPTINFTNTSPNSENRKVPISRIVLHNTEGPFESSLTRLTESKNKVSAHLLIDLDGTVTRLVADELSAWHAKSANSSSLGIEIVNRSLKKPGGGMSDVQQATVLRWVNYWMSQYKIPFENVTMHSMAPGNEGTTDCAVYIWKTPTDFLNWRKQYLE